MRYRVILAVIIVLVAVVPLMSQDRGDTASPTALCNPSAQEDNPTFRVQNATAVLNLVNAQRANAGVAPLQLETNRLYNAAQWYSDDMKAHGWPAANPHVGSDGSQFWERITREGYEWTTAAENILYRFDPDPNGVFSQWWNSAPHKTNMMNGAYVHMALAFACDPSSGRFYYTMDLAKPRYAIPSTITLLSPSPGLTFNNRTVEFRWYQDPTATQYHYWIQGNGHLDHAILSPGQSGLTCAGGVCSLTRTLPDVSASYQWWIQGINAGGEGPWSPSPTTGRVFNVTVPPGAVTLLSPSPGLTFNNRTVEFRWYHDPAATQYHYWIQGNGHLDHATLVPGQSGLTCSGGVCSLTRTLPDVSASYQWWIQAINAAGEGLWSPSPTTGRVFNVRGDTLATVIAPQESATVGLTHTLIWSKLPDATSYHYWVQGSGHLDHAILAPGSGGLTCDTSTCSLTVTVPSAGAYEWWVQGINAAGEGPWSPTYNDGWDYTVAP